MNTLSKILVSIAMMFAPGDNLVDRHPIEGIYSVEGDGPDGDHSGAAVVRKINQIFLLEYAAGTPTQGLGVLNGDCLAVTWKNKEGATGLTNYKITKDAKGVVVLRGIYATSPGDTNTYTETLTRVADRPKKAADADPISSR